MATTFEMICFVTTFICGNRLHALMCRMYLLYASVLIKLQLINTHFPIVSGCFAHSNSFWVRKAVIHHIPLIFPRNLQHRIMACCANTCLWVFGYLKVVFGLPSRIPILFVLPCPVSGTQGYLCAWMNALAPLDWGVLQAKRSLQCPSTQVLWQSLLHYYAVGIWETQGRVFHIPTALSGGPQP